MQMGWKQTQILKRSKTLILFPLQSQLLTEDTGCEALNRQGYTSDDVGLQQKAFQATISSYKQIKQKIFFRQKQFVLMTSAAVESLASRFKMFKV
jgi:hypothetical protein